MSPSVYQLGIRCLNWLGLFQWLSNRIDHFCKVWQQHRKLRWHLVSQNFDVVIELDGEGNVVEGHKLWLCDTTGMVAA
jgi:hypothetical protein